MRFSERQVDGLKNGNCIIYKKNCYDYLCESKMEILNYALLFFKEKYLRVGRRQHYSLRLISDYVTNASGGKYRKYVVRLTLDKCVPVVFNIMDRRVKWSPKRTKLYKLTVVGGRLLDLDNAQK